MSSNSVIVKLETDDGYQSPAELNSRMRRRCPALSAILPGAILRDVQVEPFRAVMSYLEGDEFLSDFRDHMENNAFLLSFAQTWVLAARLSLPLLQNNLMRTMISIHAGIIDGRGTGSKFQYTTDNSLLKAFQHLRDKIGRNTHAENFLIGFAGRTAPWIDELERNLNNGKIDRAIRNEILAEARSFDPDPIKHQPEMFFVNHKNPPIYPQLEIQANKIGQGSGRWTPAETTTPIIVGKAGIPQLPQIYGEFGNDLRKQSSKIPILKYCVRRPRSPHPTFPPPRSLPDWSDEAPDLRVCMQPGDPDGPGPWYPSQAVDLDDPSPPTTDHISILHLERRDCPDPRRPSWLPLLSSPPPLSLPPSPPSPPSLSSLPPHPPPSSPTYLSSQLSFGRFQDHEPKTPYIIQIIQHNNNAHDSANRIHDGDKDTEIAQAQGGGRRRNSNVRAVANSSGNSYKPIRERKGKRRKWFSLLTCSSKHY